MSARLTPEGEGDARACVAGAMRWRARLVDIARFAAKPTFMSEPMAWGRSAGGALAAVGTVHLTLAMLIMAPLWLWGRDTGLLPSPVRQEASLAKSLFMFVVVAPLTEELLFRGWFSGRIAALRFAAYGLVALLLMLGGLLLAPDRTQQVSLAGAVVAIIGLFHWALTRRRDTRVPDWFIDHFHWIVWGSTLLFGLIHLGNYTVLTNPAGLLVVLPQTIGGLLLAYVRTRNGLLVAILYHASYNGLFFGITLAGS